MSKSKNLINCTLVNNYRWKNKEIQRISVQLKNLKSYISEMIIFEILNEFMYKIKGKIYIYIILFDTIKNKCNF